MNYRVTLIHRLTFTVKPRRFHVRVNRRTNKQDAISRQRFFNEIHDQQDKHDRQEQVKLSRYLLVFLASLTARTMFTLSLASCNCTRIRSLLFSQEARSDILGRKFKVFFLYHFLSFFFCPRCDNSIGTKINEIHPGESNFDKNNFNVSVYSVGAYIVRFNFLNFATIWRNLFFFLCTYNK